MKGWAGGEDFFHKKLKLTCVIVRVYIIFIYLHAELFQMTKNKT